MFGHGIVDWLRRHAAEDRNSLTITIAPAQAERTFQIELPRWSVRLLAAALGLGVILILAGGVLYGRLIRDTLLVRDLREENASLRARSERIDAMESELRNLERVRAQLYSMAGIPDASAERIDPDAGESMTIIAEPESSAISGGLVDSGIDTPLRAIPLDGPVSRGFTMRTGRTPEHTAVDVAGAEGTPIASAGDGIVEFAGWDATYGNLLVIRHADGWVTKYGHNESVIVSVADSVKAGQTVALLGSTGKSSAPHLHFEITRGGSALDPALLYPQYRRSRAN